MRDLEAAYRATDYRAGEYLIRIGEVPLIDADSWAFVTACNPRSERLPDAENARRMAQLEAAVEFPFLPGEGTARDGSWPPEPSLLILGIDEATACELGRRFKQAAIVFGRRGEAARLVWIDDCVPPPHP